MLIYDIDNNSDLPSDAEEGQINPNEVKLVAKEIIRLHNEEHVAFEDITLFGLITHA